MTIEDQLRLIDLMLKMGFDKDLIMGTVFHSDMCNSIAQGFLNARIEKLKVESINE